MKLSLKQQLEGHTKAVIGLLWLPKARMLASCSIDNTIKLWNPDSGCLIRTLDAHDGYVKTLVEIGNSGLFASSSHDTTIKFWNPEFSEPLSSMKLHTCEIRPLAYDKDTGMLYSGNKSGLVAVQDIEVGSFLSTKKVVAGFAESLECCDEIRATACGTSKGDLSLLDFRMPTSSPGLVAHSDRVKKLRWNRVSQRLFSCSNDRTVKIWDMRMNICQDVIRTHTDQVYSLAFVDSVACLLSGGRNTDIKVNNIYTLSLVSQLVAHKGTVIDLATCPDESLVASGGIEGLVKVWSVC